MNTSASAMPPPGQGAIPPILAGGDPRQDSLLNLWKAYEIRVAISMREILSNGQRLREGQHSINISLHSLIRDQARQLTEMLMYYNDVSWILLARARAAIAQLPEELLPYTPNVTTDDVMVFSDNTLCFGRVDFANASAQFKSSFEASRGNLTTGNFEFCINPGAGISDIIRDIEEHVARDSTARGDPSGTKDKLASCAPFAISHTDNWTELMNSSSKTFAGSMRWLAGFHLGTCGLQAQELELFGKMTTSIFLQAK